MSDLHRAVEDEMTSFRPDQTPPFGVLLERHRARNRRRNAVGAVALSAVAVAGIVFVPSALSGGEDRLPSVANPGPTQVGDPELAARLCAGAATEYSGEVAAAYSATVDAVRKYMSDPAFYRSGGMTAGPRSGMFPYTYPTGWAEKAPTDPAAACYIDADFPTPRPPGAPAATRALIMATEGATAFMVTAGPKENLSPIPLTGPTPQDPQPTSGSDGTQYAVTYDSESALNQHVEAVQTCLNSPGVSLTGSEEARPFITSVLVIGADENSDLRQCLQGLNGVRLTEQSDAPTTGPDFTNQTVQQGFRNLYTGYSEQAGDGPVRIVERYRNEGGATRSATFVLTLREEDGRTVWVGRATVTNIAPGQEFQVTYEGTSTEPIPDGDQYQQWTVEDIIRDSAP